MKALLLLLVSGAAMMAQAPAASKSAPAKAAPKAAPKGAAAGTAPAARPSSALLNPAALKARAPDLYRVRFTTTHGDFVVEVHRDWAPLGADRFYNLVRNRFFTNAAFFRYVPNFVVQFGIPADPAIAKAWKDANIKDDPVKESNKEGSVVFATAGPNTRTTQLFVNLKDNGRSLDGQGFAPFGTVTEGMDIVKGLYAGYGEQPDQDMIQRQGKAYLDKNFPKLDSIKSATVIFPESAAPATKTGTKTGAPATKAAPKTGGTTTPPAKKQ
jgi:peptidyl-prolyl cis-trans isomerase A (cyclophilin A)